MGSQGGDDAGQSADADGHQQGVEAQLRRDRQARGNQFVDAAPGIFEGGTQFAPGQVAQVGGVLLQQRQVQPVLGLQRGLDLGNDRLFAVEGAAGRHAHQEKGDGDDDQYHRDGLQQAVADKAPHYSLPPRCLSSETYFRFSESIRLEGMPCTLGWIR